MNLSKVELYANEHGLNEVTIKYLICDQIFKGYSWLYNSPITLRHLAVGTPNRDKCYSDPQQTKSLSGGQGFGHIMST